MDFVELRRKDDGLQNIPAFFFTYISTTKTVLK